MSWLSGLRQRLSEALRPGRAARDLDDELRDHFEREVDRLRRDGTPPAEARRLAAIRVGNTAAAADAVRDERTGRIAADTLADLRLAARTARRNPGFAAAVVASLALGVGGTTAMFAIVQAVLLRPLPYADPDRLALVRIWWNDFSSPLSPADLLAVREHAASIATAGAFFEPADGFALSTESGPELVEGAIATETLLPVLGVQPLRGAGFSSVPNAPEALIGEALASRRYGTPEAAIGKPAVIDGDAYTIVGVMPAGFDVPGQRGGVVWLKALSRQPTRRGPFYLYTIVRIADGLTADAAAAGLTAAVAPALRDRYGVEPSWRYGVRPLHEALVANVRGTLLLLFGATALALLIAIVNVASLMLARGTVRLRELAVRASLGAGRARLARHLLAESALLGLLGGAAGLALAWGFLMLLESALVHVLPPLADVRLAPSVLAFSITAGVASALIAGVIPVLRTPWASLGLSLRDGGRGTAGAAGHARLRQALVVAEIALALSVVTGAALLGRSLARLNAVDPGFAPEGRASFRLALPDAAYGDEIRRAAFMDSLIDRLRGNPGVTDVALSFSLPPNRLSVTNNYTVEGPQTDSKGPDGVAEWNVVSPSYFSTLGIRLLEGRGFDGRDRAGAPRAAIVNQTFARRHFPDDRALGARLKGGDWDPESPWITIVGIVSDVPYARGVWGGTDATVYLPHRQNLWIETFYVVVRAHGDPATVLADARRTVGSLDSDLPLRDPASMSGRLHESLTEPRLRALVFVLVGALALALAMTGTYGVMAYYVQQRRQETAIRRALGATERDVVRSTLRMGLRIAIAGLGLGAAGAFALTGTLSAALYQIEPRDPWSFAIAGALLLATALVACSVPAWQSARIDPAELLRADQ